MNVQDKESSNQPSAITNDRILNIESMLERITDHLDQAPALFSIAANSIDELFKDSQSSGVDIDERIKQGVILLRRLSDPNINKAIHGLLDLTEQAPGLIAMTTDTMDEVMKKANSGTANLNDRFNAGMSLLEKISQPDVIKKIENLIKISDQLPGIIAIAADSLDEGMRNNALLDPANLRFIKSLSEAHTESLSESPKKFGGIFGMLKALKNPERQKALGYLLNVLKNLGKKL